MFKITLKIQILLLVFSTAFSASAQKSFFTDANEKNFVHAGTKRVIVPSNYRTVSLNTAGLLDFLKTVPLEEAVLNRNNTPILEIPLPDGTSGKFHIWESPIMEPALAANFPQIKTYTGQGIDDRTASIKIDYTELGFHAMILSPVTGSVFIDPYAQGNLLNYISYFKADFKKKGKFSEGTPLKNSANLSRPASENQVLEIQSIGEQLLRYRIAIACTHEYAIAATGFAIPTVAQALSAITTTVNRVDGVYESEVGVRLVLVANETAIIFTTAATDPFTGNFNESVLINQSQTQINSRIGSTNYDVGHTFSTGAGGLASLGVVCSNSNKARGVTGTEDPVGDPYDIDYVAHELGHQFGANHSFSGDQDACAAPNGEVTANAEPASGSTIMAYAGICGSDDLQLNSDPNFHAIGFNEITEYTRNGEGSSCPVIINTGNSAPEVNVPASFIIPRSTYFVLTGSATDISGDALTYSWEQTDVGGPFGAWNSAAVTNSSKSALFRSFPPVPVPSRHFPKVTTQVTNATVIGELLPTVDRTMNFRLTVRDNRANGGGVSFGQTAVIVNAAAGPFLVTYPNVGGIVWYVNEFKNITWNPSNTQLDPINCSNVSIQLSTDGGLTFPITLVANTSNDGIEEVQVPNVNTTKARIRVMAVGNIFYDISNVNFNILNAVAQDFVFNNPTTVVCNAAATGNVTLKTGALGGFAGNINLSYSGNPAGTTVTFVNNPAVAGSDIMVTLNNTAALVNGVYNVNVTGISGAINKIRTIPFIVGASTAPTSLTAPAANTTGVSTLPVFSWSSVPYASSYKLEISTSASFVPVTQTISNVLIPTHTLTTPLAENTIYYWRVSATNECGTGTPSSSPLFKTGVSICSPYTSTNVPRSISSIGAPTVTSTITIPGPSGITISDVNVTGLTGTHTFVTDLTFSLKSPANTSVLLFDQVCNDGNEYPNFNLNLDDEAATGVFPCPPTGNVTVRPVVPLSAFDGQSNAGLWTLTIIDNYAGDGGSLTGWGLNFCSYTSTPIPVTWVKFSAHKEANNSSTLLWSVNEYNNHHYDIERSIDGVKFVKIGEMAAGSRDNGNLHQYVYSDLKPVIGKNYYRLKQVDVDGRISYSVIATVVFDRVRAAWTVYPNPAKDKVNIVSNLDAVNVLVQLFDASGKLLYQNNIAKSTRGEAIPIIVNTLSRGVYTLKISSDGDSSTEKVLLQ